MLGSSLCRLYHDEHDIYAFHRDEECYTICAANYSLDLREFPQIKTLINQISPDLLIHCAGLTSVDLCEQEPALAYETNVSTCENIARACRNNVKLVYISTDQVYGEADDHSEKNTKELFPVNEYGKTKYLGEQKALEYHDNCLVVRTNIFGWNVKSDKISSAEWIYNLMKNGEKIKLFNDYFFSPIYTDYLGNIIMTLVKMNFVGIINVGSPTPCSKYDFGIWLAETFGFNHSLISQGSIKQHKFSAMRSQSLELDCRCLANLNVEIPSWMQSINMFAEANKME